jgi:glycosyltransferase involved in cell wall biosynthesis
MKILEVIHTFPPYSVGGSELYTCQLSKKLIEKGHDVKVFHRTADSGRPEYEMRRQNFENIPVITLNHNYKDFHSQRIFEDPEISHRFGTFLDEAKPDIVHFHHLTNLSLSMIEEASRRKIKTVYEMHDFWLMCPLGKLTRRDFNPCGGPSLIGCGGCTLMQLPLPRRWQWFPLLLENKILPHALRQPGAFLIRAGSDLNASLALSMHPEARALVQKRQTQAKRMCSLVDRFIVYTQTIWEHFREWDIPEEKMIVANHGYDSASLQNIPLRPRDGKIRFGYTGTLVPAKGVHILVEAFNKLNDRRAELHLFGPFAPAEGFPGYENYLRSLAKDSRIFFRGEFEHARIAEILGEIDVAVTPSLWHEGGPTTLLEPLLAGKPVLASTACGGFKDFVTSGVNGYLHTPGNIAMLSNQMKQMLEWKDFRTPPVTWKNMDEDIAFHLGLFNSLCGTPKSISEFEKEALQGGVC